MSIYSFNLSIYFYCQHFEDTAMSDVSLSAAEPGSHSLHSACPARWIWSWEVGSCSKFCRNNTVVRKNISKCIVPSMWLCDYHFSLIVEPGKPGMEDAIRWASLVFPPPRQHVDLGIPHGGRARWFPAFQVVVSAPFAFGAVGISLLEGEKTWHSWCRKQK